MARNYCTYASGFLDYLGQRGIPVADVIDVQVEQYLRHAIVLFEKQRGRRPSARWHEVPRSGIHALLRLVHGQWPPAIKPTCVADEVRFSICDEYEIWLCEERGLASRNPEGALAELRQPRPFGSVLGEMMAEHVAMMRRRGYKYTSQSQLLLRFDRFLQLHPGPETEPLSSMIDRWDPTNGTRHHAEECEKLTRVFAKILRHRDPSIPVRRPDPRPRKEAAKQWRTPHIYSPADVRRMLEVARNYPSPRAPLRPQSMYIMLLLAYCAGLRRGELARLDLGDVDLHAGTITIRQTKFFKTRILPLPGSVVVELRAYIDARRRAGGAQDARSGLFWHERGDGHYTPEMITWLLSDVIRRAGLKPLRGKAGPRVHDLRHSMVVNRILEWYRAGIKGILPFRGHINQTLLDELRGQQIGVKGLSTANADPLHPLKVGTDARRGCACGVCSIP